MINSVKISKIDLANNLTIDRENKIIKVSKQLFNAAKKYGSDECKLFEELMVKYPNYQIKQNTTKKKNSIIITYDFMTRYISKHDESGEVMNEFLLKRGLKTDENKATVPESFFNIKNWFLEKYPEVNETERKAS